MRRKQSIKEKLEKLMDSLPSGEDPNAVESAMNYLKMSENDVSRLPAFNEDGSVCFYDIGGVLLGKSGLVRFISTIKQK